MKNWWTYNLILVIVGLISTIQTSAANKKLQVQVNRWLEVRRPIGKVLYSSGLTSQPARNGMRLQAVGDTITTGLSSSTVLAIDITTGLIKVSENTSIVINKLQTGNKGGKITELQVNSGQVSLQMRPLTNSNSRVEIHTPAGVAGVRGTEFGVTVQDNGRMGVATKKGSVATTAQGQMVLVKAGFQNLTIPGEPPTKPVPLQEDTSLNIRQLIANGRKVHIVGSIDPVNLLFIAKERQNIDAEGKFDLIAPLNAKGRVEAAVITPLGKQQLYELAVP